MKRYKSFMRTRDLKRYNFTVLDEEHFQEFLKISVTKQNTQKRCKFFYCKSLLLIHPFIESTNIIGETIRSTERDEGGKWCNQVLSDDSNFVRRVSLKSVVTVPLPKKKEREDERISAKL